MKILFVSHSSLLYGAERGLYELRRGIKAAGEAEPVVCSAFDGALIHRCRRIEEVYLGVLS